ncbi:hypothetical protein L7F22_051563, partial [Adiantum nelumboides]|nr:hypothetical protein [Adiantum nelumboides]
DRYEIVQVSAGSEEKGKCEATVMKDTDDQCACGGSLFHKRRGRSKRPRRRDFAYAHYNGKLNQTYTTSQSVRSNFESNGGLIANDHGGLIAVKEKCGETNMTAKDFFIHSTASVHQSEPIKGETLVEDAIYVGSMEDVTNTEVSPAIISAGPCSESKDGLNAEICTELFQVSANSEQVKECEEIDIRNEDVSDHDSISSHPSVVCKEHTLVEDANTARAIKGEHDIVLSSECLKKINICNTEHSQMGLLPCKDLVDVCNTEHPSMGLLPGDDSQYIIQFGSIIARTSIKNGIINAYADIDRIGNRGFRNVIRHDSDDLQKTGSNEFSTGIKNVFGNAITARKSFDKSAPRNEMIMCTIESFSFESTCTSAEEKGPSTALFEADGDEEEADVKDEQEEGLDGLKLSLQAHRSLLAALEAELEIERNAAAVATNEAMAMISRLQEEKAAMQMEVAHLQRMSGERADYDEQTMAILKEILVRRETENMVLEKEVELYREKLLAGSSDDPNSVWLEEAESPALRPPCRPLLLIGQDTESHSPLRASRNRGDPWTPPGAPNVEFKELITVSEFQNSNKRSRDLPTRVTTTPFNHFDDISRTEGGLYEPHDTDQHAKKMGKCSSLTDDKTFSAPESPCMITKDLQELPGEKDLKSGKPSTTLADECHPLAFNSGKKWATSSLTESCGAQSKCGIRSEGGGEVEGGCGGFAPIYDVYEVHTAFNRSPPCIEESNPLEVSESLTTPQKELQPRPSKHITEFPPRFVTMTKLIAPEDIPSTPTSVVQAAGRVENPFYTEDPCEHHDLRFLSFVSRDERRADLEEIKQLSMRLNALEEDRHLLRETVQSFKHRDAELGMLQEISKHLQELQMVSFAGFSERAFSEGALVTSPSRTCPLKKRRYCSGLGQAQTLLQQQKNSSMQPQ